MKISLVLAALLTVVLPLTAVAQPRVIGDLSDGALLGQIQSTPQLQHDFAQNGELLAQASEDAGLTRADFARVRRAVAQGRAHYTLLPRHLDAMAGEHGGVAFAVHDVIIPPNVYGWEVDIHKPRQLVRVFIPNRCGNISYLRVPLRPLLAAAPPYRKPAPVPVAAAPIAAPQTPVALATTAPAVVAVAPVSVSSVVPAATHVTHLGFLPFLAAALIGIALGHGGGSVSSNGSTTTPPTLVPTPAPVHTICPTSIARRP